MTPRFITILQGKRIVAALFILALFGVCCFFFYEPCAKPPDDELYRDILSQFRAAQPMAVNISPDGRYIVTKEELPSGGFQIAVRDVESSRVLYTNFSKNSQRSLTWRPDSRGIVFQEIRGMDRPIYLWELESGRTTKLNAPVSKTALPPLRWDPTGKKLVYFNGDWRTGSLLIIEPEANKDPVVIKHSVGGACNFVWSQDGDRIALITASEPGVVTVASLNPLRLSVINLGGNAKMQDLAWSPDGKSILVSARRDQDEHFNLFEVEPATSRVSLKIEADGDIGNPVWLANGQSFVYHVLFDGNIRALIADREASSSKSIGPTNGVLRVSHVSPDADIGYARFASSTAPPALLRISVQTGESHPVYMPAKSREVECPQPVSIRIPSSDGTLIPAYRWSGHNGTNPPSAVLIEVHGGLHTQTYPTWESYIQVMTRRGCDVIAVNYRGSSGWSKHLSRLRSNEATEQQTRSCCFFV